MRSAEAARLFKDSSKQAVMRQSAARSSAAAFLLRWPKKGAGRRGWMTVPLYIARQGEARGEKKQEEKRGAAGCENDNRYRV